jgi:hypothetical protein
MAGLNKRESLCDSCVEKPCMSEFNLDSECFNHALLDVIKNLQPGAKIDWEAYEAAYYKARNEVPPSKR